MVSTARGDRSDLRSVRIVLIGVGNLGRRFCGIVASKHGDLVRRYGLDLRLVGVADSGGAAIDPSGLDGQQILRAKERGGTVADLPGAGLRDMRGLELLDQVSADMLCEASPVNLKQNGEPGLSHVRRALELGMHVCTPNKGPIVLAYRELQEAATRSGSQLRFDGTVAGGLPAIALGARDLRGATIHRIDSVPNLTTGFVVDQLASGMDWEEAVQNAREAGVLEGDGAWDLDGWDAAAKLVILAQSVLGMNASLESVSREGIRAIDPLTTQPDGLVRLVASAIQDDSGTYRLLVRPTVLGPKHPLGRLGSKQMGITYQTDLFGTITSIIEEPTPTPSAATMLRDLLDIACGGDVRVGPPRR